MAIRITPFRTILFPRPGTLEIFASYPSVSERDQGMANQSACGLRSRGNATQLYSLGFESTVSRLYLFVNASNTQRYINSSYLNWPRLTVAFSGTDKAYYIRIQYCNSSCNPLKTKRRLLYLKTQFVPRSKHFSSRL